MNFIKKPEEIKVIRDGGKILAAILKQLAAAAKVGMTTIELDRMAEHLIIGAGGVPAFKHYTSDPSEPPFPSTICASVNDQLVHTPASDYVLKDGDILSIDIGMRYPGTGRGFYTDMATTVPIGKISATNRKLLKITKESLALGIKQVKPGNYVSDISKAVQDYVEANGYSVVRQLVGHGVGYEVHEEPRIPNYLDSRQPKVKLVTGMVIAIEPMVNIGGPAVKTLADGWTIVTDDGSWCAHFEHTVAVTKNGVEILTAD
ncbi:MAG: type I methionyl aminopeptidase [Patescibacteria group bacterium]|nr:type I methionyl aminopeptidase [Patescibacteria group bacterium]